MARPKKIVAPVEETIAVVSQREMHIETLAKLFPRAPLAEYSDALIKALYDQHIETVRPE